MAYTVMLVAALFASRIAMAASNAGCGNGSRRREPGPVVAGRGAKMAAEAAVQGLGGAETTRAGDGAHVQ